MGVDPSDPASAELAGLDELHDLRVGHGAGPMDLGIRREAAWYATVPLSPIKSSP